MMLRLTLMSLIVGNSFNFTILVQISADTIQIVYEMRPCADILSVDLPDSIRIVSGEHCLKLNEIRRVTLHPGSGDESLLCSLTVAKVGDAGYKAVLYVWGETNGSIWVICNYGKAWDIVSDDGRAQRYKLYDINADKCVRTIRNLHSALLSLRDREGYRSLWIDSICINRDDLQERHDQALLMRLIYQKAGRILIWLGEEDGNTASAFRCLDLLFAMRGLPKAGIPQLAWKREFSSCGSSTRAVRIISPLVTGIYSKTLLCNIDGSEEYGHFRRLS